MRRRIRTLRFWLTSYDGTKPGRELVGVNIQPPSNVQLMRPGKWCNVHIADVVMIDGEKWSVSTISLPDYDPPIPGPYLPLVHSGREWLDDCKLFPEMFLGPVG